MNTSKTIEPEIIINPNTKTIQIPQELYNICVATDDNSEIIRIRVPRYFDDYDFSTKDCTITYNNALKERGIYTVTEKKVFENSILLYWCISNHVTKKAGKIHFVVEFKSSNAEHNKTYSWSTIPAELNILPWLDENVTYGGEEDNSSIEYVKLSSHKHGNMNILNKITQSMLDLIDLIKPAYDTIVSHTAKTLDTDGDGMHVPKGGAVGQVLGRVDMETEGKKFTWIDQNNNVELPENVSAFYNDAGYQTKPNVENTVNDKLSGKVDKITGKGLSSNDFTDSEKQKLAGLNPPNFIFSTTIPTELEENTICFVYEN